MVAAMVLGCGRGAAAGGLPMLTERDGVDFRPMPSRPGKDLLNPVLGELSDRRLVVIGEDADLAAVVLRLLRAEKLTEVAVGYVPISPESDAAITWSLPLDGGRALDVALDGEPDRVPLIRDDAGGVLVGLGSIGPLRGVGYCDEARVLRGPAKTVRVVPEATGGGLEVSVTHRGLFNRRERSSRGRSFEIGCLPTRVVRDGVPHERPVKRWTWYRHTEDLRLVRGLA